MDRPRPPALAVDERRFAEVRRLAAYEIANALLLMQLDLQRSFGLRAEEHQVHFLIAIATVQRYARSAGPADPHGTADPLPRDLAGAISRRRIADVLGIPLETVRRHVARLIEAGLVEERSRGRLSTPGGTLARFDAAGAPDRVARQVAAMASALLRLGVLRPEGGGPAPE